MATGTAAGRASYDAYGNTLPESSIANLTPMGHAGQYTSSDTGLIYLRAREYDPVTGQFMSVDPKVAETGEPYGYAGDDPVSAGDPSGLSIDGPHEPESYGGNERHLFRYLKVALHLSAAEVAGIIGNLIVESAYTLNPTIKQVEGSARGIAQWEPPRWDQLRAFAAGKHENPETLELQAEFLVYELTHEFKAALGKLRTDKGYRAAAATFEEGFEKAGEPHLEARERAAEGVYDELG